MQINNGVICLFNLWLLVGIAAGWLDSWIANPGTETKTSIDCADAVDVAFGQISAMKEAPVLQSRRGVQGKQRGAEFGHPLEILFINKAGRIFVNKNISFPWVGGCESKNRKSTLPNWSFFSRWMCVSVGYSIPDTLLILLDQPSFSLTDGCFVYGYINVCHQDVRSTRK